MYSRDIVEVKQLSYKFKPSNLKLRAALTWLRKNGYVVNNGAMYSLTEKGRAFHDERIKLREF